MQETDLRRLKRTDLLELLLEQSKEVERLTAELDTARQALQDRTIRMEQAGSIAEAALQLNGIFDTAQAAAQQYLDNIQMLNDRQTATCLERKPPAGRRPNSCWLRQKKNVRLWRPIPASSARQSCRRLSDR